MPVVGIGTDIVEIQRLQSEPERLRKLAQRVLTANELAQFNAHAYPVRFLAKRFAAKEAVVKALGTGIGNGVSWQHIAIEHTEQGAPVVRLVDAALARAESLGANSWLISIADEQHYAVATAVLSAG